VAAKHLNEFSLSVRGIIMLRVVFVR